jgi:uncharacterized repeat protein (TIGR03803 family)
MKTALKNLFFMPALIAGLGLIPAGRAATQTYTIVCRFTGGSDGSHPEAGLILSGNTLYGTAMYGGSGEGTVFAVNTDSTGITNLHSFSMNTLNSIDGAQPKAGLILSGNTLYGTATLGGSGGRGTVFAVNIDGSGFTNLHSFTGVSDGANPEAGLILSGNILYGTAYRGGSSNKGTVFAVNTDGTGFTTLHSFTNGSDGANPEAGLILSGNTLYGTAFAGGSSGYGTVFAINTNGTGFTTLHEFTGNVWPNPGAGLILSGNTLYGTTQCAGSSSNGTVFAVNTNGTGFTNLYSFTGGSDGSHPYAGLILSGNTLYGTAAYGGIYGYGTVFAINTNGTGFTILHSFAYGDGYLPLAGLILSGNTLYGTTFYGTYSYNGSVFALSLVPSLGIAQTGNQVVLSWPTWAPNFSLQSNTNLVSSALWTAVSPAPIVVNGRNTVTNPVSGAQMFYRLSQ